MTPQQEEINFTEIILKGSRDLGIPVTQEVAAKMFRYSRLLQQWNRKINLTSLRDSLEIALFHFLDSLTVFRVIEPGSPLRILDLGTGAGFPGMVMKIVDNSLKMSLLDRDARKIVFLKYVASELTLSDITYLNTPLRSVIEGHPPASFDVVVSRAFSADSALWDSLSVLLGPSGSLVRMSGPSSLNEDFPLRNFAFSGAWEGFLPFSKVYRRVIVYRKV
jgi:16S rRNA (guanine527-N7)-methyltransferase